LNWASHAPAPQPTWTTERTSRTSFMTSGTTIRALRAAASMSSSGEAAPLMVMSVLRAAAGSTVSTCASGDSMVPSSARRCTVCNAASVDIASASAASVRRMM
jgi:hypothetical protein